MLSSFQKDMLKKLVIQSAKNPDALIGIFVENDSLIDEGVLKLKLKPLEEGTVNEQTIRVGSMTEVLALNQQLLTELQTKYSEDYPV